MLNEPVALRSIAQKVGFPVTGLIRYAQVKMILEPFIQKRYLKIALSPPPTLSRGKGLTDLQWEI